MYHFKPEKVSLHRTQLRFLPYTMFGAFLIALKSSNNFSSLLQSYFVLLGIQFAIVVLYLSATKVLKKEK
jgi:hypothetical protein